MPETIVLEDGTEREVLTDEEKINLQKGHDANKEKKPIVEQHQKIIESLELKEGQTVEERLQELKEAENPNWKKTRETLKILKDAAKEKGVEIDDEGNVVGKGDALTSEKIQEIANQTFQNNQIKAQKDNALSQFSKDDAKNISDVFDEIKIPGATFEERLGIAIERVLPGQGENALKQAINNPGGGGPKPSKPGDVSSDLKDFGAKQFGLSDEDFEKAK